MHVRHPLLLAAQELRRIRTLKARQSNRLQRADSALAGLRAGDPLYDHRRFHDVLDRRQVVEQVEVLKHHSNARSLSAEFSFRQLDQLAGAALTIAQKLVGDADLAAIDRQQMVDTKDQRGLPRSGRSDDRGGVAFRYVQRDVVQRRIFVSAGAPLGYTPTRR